MKRKKYKMIAALFGVMLCAAVTLILYPYIERLSNPQYQSEISRMIQNIGISGPLLLLLAQFIQVVIAFIPGEPFEILSGALYGAYGGLILCLIGSIAASLLIFKVSKKYGKRVLYSFFSEEKIEKWVWLKDSKKTDLAVFLLFLIPGTPKDMLTYIVGISGIKTGKFIMLSSLARIPSVLSSTMIGAAIRHGDAKNSVLLFAVIGIIGITGICLNDLVLKNCKNKKTETEKLQALDLLQTIDMDQVYPLIYCHIQFDTPIDIDCLKTAVEYTRSCIPEICYAYNAQKHCFTDFGYTTDKLFTPGRFTIWDLEKDTQLKIFCSENGCRITIGISHILCDGNGFLQYLYMLSEFYNGKPLQKNQKNHREIIPLMKEANIKQIKKAHKHIRYQTTKRREVSKQAHYFLIKEVISADDFYKIYRKTKRYGFSINDVFSAAYGKVMCDVFNLSYIRIPCPVNLRTAVEDNKACTIANMTGLYDMIIQRKNDITETAKQVHAQIKQQKEDHCCFRGIKLLNFIYRVFPPSAVRSICRKFCQLPALSYSNIGKIDADRFTLNGHITECFLSSAYRHIPDFQLTTSTYRNTAALNCSVFGNSEDERLSKDILNSVKTRLIRWSAV